VSSLFGTNPPSPSLLDIQQMVEDRILLQELRRSGVTVLPEDVRQRLANWDTSVQERAKLLPRVEVVGNGEDIDTRVYIPPKDSESTDSVPRSCVFEAQFLFHDVLALKNVNCRVGEFLKKPGYEFTPNEINLMASWMLLEIRFAVGCRFKWKRAPQVALVAPTDPGHCFCYELGASDSDATAGAVGAGAEATDLTAQDSGCDSDDHDAGATNCQCMPLPEPAADDVANRSVSCPRH
jgi:hypothetical protein